VNQELTHHSFKKFHIVIEEIDGDDVRLILESNDHNGFSIEFKIKILEITKLILDLEIIEKNIENNSLDKNGIIKRLISRPVSFYPPEQLTNILVFEGLDVDENGTTLPYLDLTIDSTFISIPFVNFNEVKEFCNIFKQMVCTIFSQCGIEMDENINSNISKLEEQLKLGPGQVTRVFRTEDGKMYRVDEEYEKQRQERLQENEKRQAGFTQKRKEFEQQIMKSLDKFIEKTSLKEFEKHIVEKINAITLVNRVNPNKIKLRSLILDIMKKEIFADVPNDDQYPIGNWIFHQIQLTPIQKKYSDILENYSGPEMRSAAVLQAQEEASEFILEQLKTYEKVTRSLIKVVLIKNQFTQSMVDFVYFKYKESTK